MQRGKKSKTSAGNFHEANGDQVKFEKWRKTRLYGEVNKSIHPHNHPKKRKYKSVLFGLEAYIFSNERTIPTNVPN